MKKTKDKKRIVPRILIPATTLLLLTALLLLISRNSPLVADFVNSYIATPLRYITAKMTHPFPISLFEVALLSFLPFLVGIIVLAVRRDTAPAEKLRAVLSGVSAIAIFYSGYLTVMSIPYNTTPLAEHLGIEERQDISRDDLYLATLIVRDNVNELSPRISREGGEGVMPYDLREASYLICEAYDGLRADYPFFLNFTSAVKPVFFSGIMSDMGISGIYTYFTGEANVNTSYPDYCTVFTAAHEMAHQRGINRENEANLMAFLALSYSEDEFLRYSAYLNLYEYLSSALYRADKDAYFELRSGLDADALSDIAISNAVTVAHRDSPLYKLMNNVNDAYLKSNGTEGVVTYGYVVRLAVAYLLK